MAGRMKTLCAAAALVCALCGNAMAAGYPFQDARLSDTARVQDFVARLTLEEKISLLSGEDNWHLPDIPRLGVRGLIMTDGPAGLRSFESEPSTAFPVGAASGATWDPDLIRREGHAIGEETLGHGVDLILGPMVNLVRVPLAGSEIAAGDTVTPTVAAPAEAVRRRPGRNAAVASFVQDIRALVSKFSLHS